MKNDFKVITICGSTKFKKEYIETAKRLTLEKYIVLTCNLFGHSGDMEVNNDEIKQMLDEMHFAKIDMSDEIFVINKDGYIGESTRNEINYATKNNKKITYLEIVI